jgi:hypothetical protein
MGNGKDTSGLEGLRVSRGISLEAPTMQPYREDAASAATRRSVAAYIADLATQLESMALAAGLDLAAYFLTMARSECEARAGETAPQKTTPSQIEPPSEDEGQSPFDFGRPKS